MSGSINEKEIIHEIIDALLLIGEKNFPNKQFENEDNIIKIKILKMMFQLRKELEILYYNKNKLEVS